MGLIILARHGLTDWNAQQLRLGSSDVPLNEDGRRQAERLAESLASIQIDRVYASDLSRARDTARMIASRHNQPVTEDARLRERDHGRFEGTRREVECGVDIMSRLTERECVEAKAEPMSEVWERVTQAFLSIRASNMDGTVVIVSHYGPLRLMLAKTLQLSAGDRKYFEFSWGSIAAIRTAPSGDQILALNSASSIQDFLTHRTAMASSGT